MANPNTEPLFPKQVISVVVNVVNITPSIIVIEGTNYPSGYVIDQINISYPYAVNNTAIGFVRFYLRGIPWRDVEMPAHNSMDGSLISPDKVTVGIEGQPLIVLPSDVSLRASASGGGPHNYTVHVSGGAY